MNNQRSIETKKCIIRTEVDDFFFLSEIERNKIYLSKNQNSWFRAYSLTKKINKNLLVLKCPIKMFEFIKYLIKNKRDKSYWVKKFLIRKNLTNYCIKI